MSREEKIRQVAAFRQTDLTVILENVHDPHNISAIVRTCDAVGVPEVYVLYTDPGLHDARLWLGKHSTAGSRKWVKVHLYRQTSDLLPIIKSRYGRLIGAVLTPQSAEMYGIDFRPPTAIILGNERTGLSAEAIAATDAQFSIPMVGMVGSLNVSVAASIVLYEAFRQRRSTNNFKNHEQNSLMDEYLSIGMKKQKPRRTYFIDEH